MKRQNFSSFKKFALKDPVVKAEYATLKTEFDFIHQLILARKKAKISQTELALLLGTKQPAIARFESGGFERSSLATIRDYAAVLGYELRLKLIKHKAID